MSQFRKMKRNSAIRRKLHGQQGQCLNFSCTARAFQLLAFSPSSCLLVCMVFPCSQKQQPDFLRYTHLFSKTVL